MASLAEQLIHKAEQREALFGIIGGKPGTTVRIRSIPRSQARTPSAPKMAPTKQSARPNLLVRASIVVNPVSMSAATFG